MIFVCFLTLCSFCYGQNDGFIKTADVDIYYQVFGNGTPILIINGGPGMSSEGFIPLAKTLAKNHQTIIYDQRGTGRSAMKHIDKNTITMDLMVDDMEILRKHLKIDNWIVMGHSFGGMLASYYTSKHPEKITALILSSSGGFDMEVFTDLSITTKLSPSELDSLNYWTGKISNGDNSYHARLQRGKYLAPAYLYYKKHVPVIAERLTQGNNLINGLVFNDMKKIGFDCKKELQTYKNQVLIIQGKQDIIKEGIALKASAILPNSKIVLIDKCGHYGWLDQKETYFKEIELFLLNIQG